MAIEYAKVLKAQHIEFIVIGRGGESAELFANAIGVEPQIGGIEVFLEANKIDENTKVIIATGTEVLMHILKKVLQAGAGNVLVEKPAAISIAELLENESFLMPYKHKVFVAYNRRFYASVTEVSRLIEEDGGLKSMHFEFTEWPHRIEPLTKAPGVKENWFFANSTHVIDLAFYLAGSPADWHAYSRSGDVKWHDKTSFVGAGITAKQVMFSYISNWESAGRWAIELLTNKRRIYLKPLERIEVQLNGTVAVVNHPFDDQLDVNFKPGLYAQVEAYYNNDAGNLCSLEQHISNTRNTYFKILS